MGIALLGHGGLELAGGYPEGMGIVAIGPGTTLQVYTDTGQTLLMGEEDYELFSKLDAPWGALDSTRVTYNLELTINSSDVALEQDSPGFFARTLAPHTPVIAGMGDAPSPFLLCTGTPQTCPTDPRMSTGEVEGPPEHTCNGILGRYKGQEIHWLVCTVVYHGSAEVKGVVETAMGVAPESVQAGVDPDDPSATWYALEASYPSELNGWFDEQNDTVKGALRADPHIAEWEQNRG